jgi:hypothetical protein
MTEEPAVMDQYTAPEVVAERLAVLPAITAAAVAQAAMVQAAATVAEVTQKVSLQTAWY